MLLLMLLLQHHWAAEWSETIPYEMRSLARTRCIASLREDTFVAAVERQLANLAAISAMAKGHFLPLNQVIVDVKDIVLRDGFDAEVVQDMQDLSAVVGAVVDNLMEHMPDAQVFILAFEGLGHEDFLG